MHSSNDVPTRIMGEAMGIYVYYGTFFLLMIYVLFVVPFFGSRILTSLGEEDRMVWFCIIFLFNILALLFVLARKSYRVRVPSRDIKKLGVLKLGYIVFVLLHCITTIPWEF